VVVEVRAGLLHLGVAREGRHHRLLDPLLPRLRHHASGELGEDHRWGHDGVPVAEDQGVDPVVLQTEPDRGLVRRRRLATGDVDRVARGTERRDELPERLVEVRWDVHEREAVLDTRVGQQHP
jgi:hypothetical protein